MDSIIRKNYPKLVRNKRNGKVYVMSNIDYDLKDRVASCMVQEVKIDTLLFYETLSDLDKYWEVFKPVKGETLISNLCGDE